MVMEHRQREEKQSGVEIWPATPKVESSENLEEEQRFCSELDAASCMSKAELAW